MNTNFFTELQNAFPNDQIRLTIAKSDNGEVTLSVIAVADHVEDNATEMIKPLLLRGTAEEMDEAFFSEIAEPMNKATGLINNMSGFLQGVEQARIESKMNSDSKLKEKVERAEQKKLDEERKRQWEEISSQIAEHEVKTEYAQAFALIPELEQFPDKETEITKMKQSLTFKKSQKSLF